MPFQHHYNNDKYLFSSYFLFQNIHYEYNAYENDVLKQIAKELTISIKNNIKVDWDVRESVRAQMRITVKRLLRKYKYPPDKQATAVDLIIEQAEKMCESELDK